MDRKKQHGNTRYWNLVNSYSIAVLVEHTVNEIRKMNLLEKNKNIPVLVKVILEWGTTSPAEAIGTLDIVKQHFIQLALTEQERKI
jgi:hypothetical protein